MTQFFSSPLYMGSLILAVCQLSCARLSPCDLPDETGTTIQLGQSIDVSHNTNQVSSNPMAQALAEAMRKTAVEADFAFLPSDIFAERQNCEPQTFPAGPFGPQRLEAMLVRDTELILVELNRSELQKTLEHAVSHIGEFGLAGRSPRFLQVAGLQIEADCTRAAQEGSQIGQRIRRISRIESEVLEQLPDFDQDETRYRVVTTLGLTQGAHGHQWLSRTVPEFEFQTLLSAAQADWANLTQVPLIVEPRWQIECADGAF